MQSDPDISKDAISEEAVVIRDEQTDAGEFIEEETEIIEQDGILAEINGEREIAEDADDPVFIEEQKHLSATYEILEDISRKSLRAMGAIAYEAALDKESMAEELAINYATFDDILETGADFEAVNSIIDSYNLSHSVQADRFSAAEALLKQPYFAKLSLAYERDGKTKELYIGVAGISDENYKRIIVDWRSPVAEVYYNQATGKTSYMADGRTISVDVKLRRQFDIERDILKGYFDSDVVIEDSLLLSSLARHRSAHMKDITATIQKEQNVVIRHDDVGALLVSGIAGSGKTSVLLQRIAYLFYQKRGSLKPEEVVLITPNPVFRRYIDHVLPDLGERNPNLLTYEEFMSPLLPKGRGVGSASAGLDAIEAIDKAMEGFDFLPQDFLPIVIHHVKLLGEDQVWKASQKYSYIEAGPHRAALIREALIARLDARLAQLASVEEIHNEVESLSVEDQLRLFDEMYEPQTEKEEREAALIYLKDRFKDGYAAIERDDWLNVDGLGKRLLHSHGLTSPEWLYLKMSVTGLGEPSIKYVMIDEVQDYNAAQIAVLAKYYRRAHFLLLGDPNQAIFENTASFDTISEVFARTSGNIERCDLITSYRSTPAITRLFASLLPSGHKGAYTSVLRDEDSPVIIEYDDHDNYIDHLRSLVRLTGEEGGLCAFIVLWKQDAKRLQGMLGEDAPMVIGEGDQLPDTGPVIIPLRFAKGLEFDTVVLPDVSARAFDGSDLSRRRLYTAISRATRHITLLSPGKITPLLSGFVSESGDGPE